MHVHSYNAHEIQNKNTNKNNNKKREFRLATLNDVKNNASALKRTLLPLCLNISTKRAASVISSRIIQTEVKQHDQQQPATSNQKLNVRRREM